MVVFPSGSPETAISLFSTRFQIRNLRSGVDSYKLEQLSAWKASDVSTGPFKQEEDDCIHPGPVRSLASTYGMEISTFFPLWTILLIMSRRCLSF